MSNVPLHPISLARRSAAPDRFRDTALSALEAFVVIVLYGALASRLLKAWICQGQPAGLLLLPSEGLVVFFMLVRRPSRALSQRVTDWALAAGATIAPLCVAPGVAGPLVAPAAAAPLMLMGLLLQLSAKLTLGRSFGCVAAHRGLKTRGPYRVIRHPMYAGYLITHVAYLLMSPTLRNLLAYVAALSLQIPRLLAEERLLAHDPDYRAYSAAVPDRLIPGVY